MRKPKLNTKQVIDGVIAGIAVSTGPTLLNQYVLKGSLQSGMALKAAGVGVAYLAAMLFKKPGVLNAGVGFVLTSLANDVLVSAVGVPTATDSVAIKPALVKTAVSKGQPMADFMRINDYGGASRVGRFQPALRQYYNN